MSEVSKVDFDEDFELNHILSQRFRKKEIEKNRNILRTIEGVYKKLYNILYKKIYWFIKSRSRE